ncbi:hypothetical protein [Desulfosarcina ovata]|uniref:hypothetical protein n=1 Tax=Desulfosarcina ovata TaxID=83564 RepID=UPI0012D2FC18|nr:hypothetical protein [Desulfosarcina ovata]
MTVFKILEITGALASISAWIMAYFNWQGDDHTKTMIAAFTGIVLAILTIWAHYSKHQKDTSNEKYDILSDILFVMPEPDVKVLGPKKNRNVYTINYPRPFKFLPNLKVECIRGGGKLILFDETKESFKIKVVRPMIPRPFLKKVKVHWIAKGQLIE